MRSAVAEARVVRAERHVHRDPDHGIDAVGRGLGPAQADLLLHRGHRVDLGRRVEVRHPAQGFENDEGARAIVHAAPGDPPALQVLDVVIQHQWIAHRDKPLGFLAALRPDVDPELVDLRDLLALFLLLEVDGALADDPGDVGFPAANDDVLALCDLGIPSPHRGRSRDSPRR